MSSVPARCDTELDVWMMDSAELCSANEIYKNKPYCNYWMFERALDPAYSE